MHSETAIETRAAARGRRRKRGNGPAGGPVFVDTSGRRARLLRRIGLLLGVVCSGYAIVLGLAFMGIGTSINPSSLLPFGASGNGTAPGGGIRPQGGTAPGGVPSDVPGRAPGGAPTGAPPSAAADSAPAPAASATAPAPAASATAPAPAASATAD
ncbi:hypothetical protein ABZ397_01495 [Streptomyces sp. NPDC005876]|uniref:hypothetical protein n=1 Tax=Streptomyces sp. NPDC005876 TaxID=3157076 RepID=UPI0033F87A86